MKARKLLPRWVQSFFSCLEHHPESIRPLHRRENYPLLRSIGEALTREQQLTYKDMKQLMLILGIADRITLPKITDIQSLQKAEAQITSLFSEASRKAIAHALRWLYLLLARHGFAEIETSQFATWCRIWRVAQSPDPSEYEFNVGYIQWMQKNDFAPRTIELALFEYKRLRQWMLANGTPSISAIGNQELQKYMLFRAGGYKNTSKKRYLGNLRTVFHYYREVIDSCYSIPTYSAVSPNPLGINQAAHSFEIEAIWSQLEAGGIPAMAALMLLLLIGYGLPVKALPLLQLTEQPGRLTLTMQAPSRKGLDKREVAIDLNTAWLALIWESYLKTRQTAYPESHYVFFSKRSIRTGRPVSTNWCEDKVNQAIKSILGYGIPLSYLQRGSIKRLAREKPLSEFMRLTEPVPKSRMMRMFYWKVENKK